MAGYMNSYTTHLRTYKRVENWHLFIGSGRGLFLDFMGHIGQPKVLMRAWSLKTVISKG